MAYAQNSDSPTKQTFCLLVFLFIFSIIILLFSDYLISSYLSLVIFTLFAAIFLNYIKQSNLSVIFMIAFIVRFLFVILVPTVQTSDFQILQQAAISVTKGDFSFLNEQYFLDWAYQIGFVLYQATVIALSGSETLSLQFLNIIATSLSVVAVYYIGMRIFSKQSAIIAAAIYALYLPPIVSSALLTNQHIATLLFLLATLCLLNAARNPIYWVLLSGFIAALGNFIRPEGIVLIAGASLYLMMRGVADKKYLHSAFLTFALILSYNASFEALNSAVNLSGFYDGRLTNNNPKWKFVLGLNVETKGYYSSDLAHRIASAGNNEDRDLIESDIITSHLSNKTDLLSLFVDKFVIMWSGKDEILWWSLRETNLEKASVILSTITDAQFFLIMTVFSVGIVYSYRNINSYILFFILMLNAGVYLLIEIQTRYRYFAMPFIVVYAGYGYTVIENYVTHFKARLRGNPPGN